MTTERIRRMWPDVLNALSHLKRATWSLVSQHAQVLDFDGNRLLLGFGSPGLAGTFGRGAHQEFLRQAMIEAIGLDCRVDTVAGDRAGDQPGDRGGDRAGGSAARGPSAPPPPVPSPVSVPPVPASAPLPEGPLPDEPPPDDEPSPEDEPPPRARRPAPPEPPARPRPTVAAAQDQDVSVDDPDIEGSGLVGRPVVEQLLGGRVIEERDE